MRTFLVAILLFAASSANAQQVAPAPKFIRENSAVIALTHVQLIRFQERRGLRLKRDLRKPPRAGWTAVTD